MLEAKQTDNPKNCLQDREQSSSQHLANIPDLHSFLQEDSDNLIKIHALCGLAFGFNCGVWWVFLLVCFKGLFIKQVSESFTI